MFLLLFLLISFGSVCAVMFTPALPQMSIFFGVSISSAQLAITIYLIGYAWGQLPWGPITHAYGRKKALYAGICLAIVASIFCVISAMLHQFWILVLARFFMAIGASVGVKMVFTIVSDCYEPPESTRLTSHLMSAFAIMPGIAVALGGLLSQSFSWESNFYFLIIYGLFLLLLISRMPETAKSFDSTSLKFSKIMYKYTAVLKNKGLILNGILLGISSGFIYLFAAKAPFITQQLMHLNSTQYGLWNLLPPFGIIIGSQLTAHFANKLSLRKAIFWGIGIAGLGILIMLLGFLNNFITPIVLFLPTSIIYIGLSFVFANASVLALGTTEDKSSGSAMMGFINLSLCMLAVMLTGGLFNTSVLSLPVIYMGFVIFLFFINQLTG